MPNNKNIKSSGERDVRFNKTGIAVIAAALAVVAVISIAAAGLRPHSPAVKTSVPPSSSSAVKTKSSSAPVKAVVTTNTIPVIMFHSITYDPKDPRNILRVPKEKFEAEMKWLYDNNYKTLTLDEFYSHISGGVPFRKKSVVLTFDDGYIDNYINAFPIIKKYRLNATVFMITSKIDDSKDGYLTADQIKEMDAGGMRIEGHTVTHPALNTLTYASQLRQLTDSKAALEKLLGRSISYMAYPSGKHNADTIKAAKAAGYKICFNMDGGPGRLGNSLYEFPRSFVGSDLNQFISAASAS